VKNHGCTFEYEQQRNRELLKAFREEIVAARHIVRDEVLERTVNRPCSRFWVSEDRAAIVMSCMLKGDTLQNMRPLKREMFKEIFRRFMALKTKFPAWSILKLATDAVNQQAPKFYLTPGSAKVIISRIKRKAKNLRNLL
jgi:hypothetical protein